MLIQTDFPCPAKHRQHPDAWRADTPQLCEGRAYRANTGQQTKQLSETRQAHTASAGNRTNDPNDYKAKKVLMQQWLLKYITGNHIDHWEYQ